MTKRKLKLWEALALSLGLIGPTMAMAGNGQGIISSVGKAVPLVFLLGFIGVSLVAYGFIRLTQRYNHAGSAYALVGATIGPRAGFIAGFGLLGSYLFFTICSAAVFGAFMNALLRHAGVAPVGFGVMAAAGLVVNGWLASRDTRRISQLLLAIEGIGIVGMLALVIVIFGKGGSPATGIDLTVFNPSGVGLSHVLAAVVAAFLSWAGFEGCAALGEETDDPKRNIPRALFGSVLLTGVLFVVVMFAQTVGFGTDEAGLQAFMSSGNTLGDLGTSYVANWFGIALVVTAVLSAFASNLSSLTTTARMTMALARDGFGPHQLAKVDATHHSPRNAVVAVTAIGAAVSLASWSTGWPEMGTGDAAIDSFFFFAVVGVTCLIFVYLLVEVAVFVASRKGLIRVRGVELLLPGLGGIFILVVIFYNLKDTTGLSPAAIAVIWTVAGVVIAAVAKKLTARIGRSLSHELGQAESGDSESSESAEVTGP